MGWSKPSETLLEMLEDLVQHVPYERKKMFGQYALFLNGHMFAGVFQDDLFIRYPLDMQKDLIETCDEVENFQPMKGRVMREYLTIPETIYSDKDEMRSLLETSISVVRSLPPKAS